MSGRYSVQQLASQLLIEGIIDRFDVNQVPSFGVNLWSDVSATHELDVSSCDAFALKKLFERLAFDADEEIWLPNRLDVVGNAREWLQPSTFGQLGLVSAEMDIKVYLTNWSHQTSYNSKFAAVRVDSFLTIFMEVIAAALHGLAKPSQFVNFKLREIAPDKCALKI